MKLFVIFKEILTSVGFMGQVVISLLIEVFLIFPFYKLFKPLLSNPLPRDIKILILIISFMLVFINLLISFMVNSIQVKSTDNQIILKKVLNKSLNFFMILVLIINLFILNTIKLRTFYFFLAYLFSVILTIVNIVYDLSILLYIAVLKNIDNIENKVSIIVSLVSLLIAAFALLA